MTHAPPLKRGPTRRATAGVLIGLALALVPQAASADVPVSRLEGDTAVAAAIAWSQATFADGSASAAILARDDDFADALASGTAQSRLHAPLLFTDSQVLSPETLLEIQRVGADEVVVLGGTAAVSDGVIAALELAGLTVSRVGGATRLDTAVLLAERFYPGATAAVLARAFGTDTDPTQAFADALTATAYATAAGVPVILSDTAALSAETAEYLTTSTVEDVLVLGGTAAIADGVIAEIEALPLDAKGPEAAWTTHRVAGPNRFATSVALAVELGYPTAASAPRVMLAEGQAMSAASTGLPGGTQGGFGAAMVLANGEDLPPETLAYLEGGNVPLLCGPGVSDAACDAAEAALTP